MNTIERTYAMRTVGNGLYLLPSNDLRRFYLIERYEEDGSAETGDGRTITGIHWRVYRIRDEALTTGGVKPEYLCDEGERPSWDSELSYWNLVRSAWHLNPRARVGADVIADVVSKRREAIDIALQDSQAAPR